MWRVTGTRNVRALIFRIFEEVAFFCKFHQSVAGKTSKTKLILLLLVVIGLLEESVNC